MKKFKYNIEKNEAILKELQPKTYDFLLLWFGLFGCVIGHDLGLELFTNACGLLFLCQLGWCLCWFVSAIVHFIIKNKRKKKEVQLNEDK